MRISDWSSNVFSSDLVLEDMVLDQPGVNKLIRAAYRLLHLVTYFTAGVQEVRAWTITRGMTAPEAAGVIHTDFENGFIRAEVIYSDDYITYGPEHPCPQLGRAPFTANACPPLPTPAVPAPPP